ncbi:MAG TPA: Dam family site-specific DNA-(adenine-N6)-methyltransferase [Acidobacteriaceae bacterium]
MKPSESHPTPQVCAPFLRWAGSKRRLVPVLKKFWTTEHERYVEPFAGSACLFFAICPPKAILGDLNPELIKTYLEVKYRLSEVSAELQKLGPADKDEYIGLRLMDPSTLPGPARAARFIYLNRYCFNGIYRTNLNGQFNVPYSGVACGSIPTNERMKRCQRRLRNARFVSGDFEKVLAHARKGDLVYMDPPFAVRSRRVFREYDARAFSYLDIQRLRKWMLWLDRAGIDFVVSYAESDEADNLRKGFGYETVAVRRHIAGFAGSRALTNEVLISNI